MSNEWMTKIADAIVDALVERLSTDERFIKAVASSPWMPSSEGLSEEAFNKRVDDKINVALADFISSVELADGFKSEIESALNNFDVEANTIKGFGEEVEEIVGGMTLTVDADDVNDLDDRIENAVEEGIKNFSPAGLDAFNEHFINLVCNDEGIIESIAGRLQIGVK